MYEDYLYLKKHTNERALMGMKKEPVFHEFCRRIENGYDAWEGITWVIDLLPDRPYKAIEALESYVLSQVGSLPDDRIDGIQQCIDIILAKFIYFEEPARQLLELKPRQFEILIEELYKNMGYETILTKATRDGGKDIIAKIKRYDGNDLVYVECKLYRNTLLDIDKVKSFGYTILENKVNRGVIFCTGYVNENIKKLDRRIQIWTYEEINILLNAHLGSEWVKNLYNIIEKC